MFSSFSAENQIFESDLMLAPDGSVFHLRLRPQDISDTIILVGDPGRVAKIGGHLQGVQSLAKNREFTSISGFYRGVKITVLSTGIGGGCVDIALTELDALVNVDLDNRLRKSTHSALRIVRIGTSGALNEQVENGHAIITSHSIGLDGIGYYYSDLQYYTISDITQSFTQHLGIFPPLPTPYCVASSRELVMALSHIGHTGFTLSVPGFYGSQGRTVRLSPAIERMVARAATFSHRGESLLNMEMESGALNALAAMLGHQAVTICLVIDNRKRDSTMVNYSEAMEQLIEKTLSALVE